MGLVEGENRDERRTLRCSYGRIGLQALQRGLHSRERDYLRSQSTRPLGLGLWRCSGKSQSRLGQRRFSTRRWRPGAGIGRTSVVVVVVEGELVW